MGVRGEHGEPVAIIGMACRFPGAGDPAEFHDLTVAGRSSFEPTAGLDGRPLHAALLEDWAVPFSDMSGAGSGAGAGEDFGPVQKLAAETAALALADAGLREAAGTSRTGLIIASSAPGVCEQVREQFGVAAGGPYPDAAYHSSMHAVAGAASALQAGLVDLAVAAGSSWASTWPGWPGRLRPARSAPTRCGCTPPTRPDCCPARDAAWWCLSARPTRGRPGCRSTRS